MSLDLKDAYFHIQVAPHHRWFLRFAFEGVACQYKVLPFGLSLAPSTIMRCMDAALFPLRQIGIRILNYLDDWLILAQSEAVSTLHKTLLLSHLCCLGLRVNFAKSILSPSQWVSFLGTVIDSVQMTATVSAEQATTIQRHAASFKKGTARLLKAFQKMLGKSSRKARPASHMTHPVLAEAKGFIRGLASRMPQHNSDSGLCIRNAFSSASVPEIGLQRSTWRTRTFMSRFFLDSARFCALRSRVEHISTRSNSCTVQYNWRIVPRVRAGWRPRGTESPAWLYAQGSYHSLQGPGSEPASAAPGGGRPSPGFARSSSRIATIHRQNSKPQDLRPALCLLQEASRRERLSPSRGWPTR